MQTSLASKLLGSVGNPVLGGRDHPHQAPAPGPHQVDPLVLTMWQDDLPGRCALLMMELAPGRATSVDARLLR